MKSDKLSGQQIFPLGFYLGSKLNPTASVAGFRPLDICLLIKDFTSCLVELSFNTTDKQERAPKYKCQNQWIKRRKIFRMRYHSWCWTCPDSSPSFSQMSSKTREMKRERVCQRVGMVASTFSQFYQPVRTDKAVPGQRTHFWNHDSTPVFKVTQRNTLHKAKSPPDHRRNKFHNGMVWKSQFQSQWKANE